MTPQAQFSDQFTHCKNLAKIWSQFAMLGTRMGPVGTLRAVNRFPWVKILLEVNSLYAKLVRGRTGLYQEANAALLLEFAESGVRYIEDAINNSGRLILHEDVVPSEILHAMGLVPWCTEFLGFLLPMLSPHCLEPFIDECELAGISSDTCSLPKSTMGMILSDQMPDPQAFITSNAPCDGGMASYRVMAEKTDVPVYWLDVPYHFHDERAVSYFADQLTDMIHWLEKKTGAVMDYAVLQQVCDERNRMVEYELDLWDSLRHKPAPMAGEPVYLSHMWAYTVYPGRARGTHLYKRLAEFARKGIETQNFALETEKFRTLLWGPFPAFLMDLFTWVEETYHTAMLTDSLSFNRLPVIDTSSEESTLRGLAHTIMHGPMARHSRGPCENYFDDLFFACDNYSVDMVWVGGHLGCKNSQALYGMLAEKCREKGLPLLILEYDLSDPRLVDANRVKSQVAQFMENVMQA